MLYCLCCEERHWHLPFCSIIFGLNDCHSSDKMQILLVNLWHQKTNSFFVPQKPHDLWPMNRQQLSCDFLLVDFGSQNILFVWNQIQLGLQVCQTNNLGPDKTTLAVKKKNTDHTKQTTWIDDSIFWFSCRTPTQSNLPNLKELRHKDIGDFCEHLDGF